MLFAQVDDNPKESSLEYAVDAVKRANRISICNEISILHLLWDPTKFLGNNFLDH